MKNICCKYDQGDCVKCADAAWQECEAKGLAAEYLKIDTPGQRGHDRALKLNWSMYNKLTDATLAPWISNERYDKSVSDATLNYGVDVNGVVYDNVFPCGIARSEWKKIFCSGYNVSVVKTTP